MIGAGDLVAFDRVYIDRHQLERFAALRHTHEVARRGTACLAADNDAVIRQENLLDFPFQVRHGGVKADDGPNDLIARSTDIIAAARGPFRGGGAPEQGLDICSGAESLVEHSDRFRRRFLGGLPWGGAIAKRYGSKQDTRYEHPFHGSIRYRRR